MSPRRDACAVYRPDSASEPTCALTLAYPARSESRCGETAVRRIFCVCFRTLLGGIVGSHVKIASTGGADVGNGRASFFLGSASVLVGCVGPPEFESSECERW